MIDPNFLPVLSFPFWFYNKCNRLDILSTSLEDIQYRSYSFSEMIRQQNHVVQHISNRLQDQESLNSQASSMTPNNPLIWPQMTVFGAVFEQYILKWPLIDPVCS